MEFVIQTIGFVLLFLLVLGMLVCPLRWRLHLGVFP